MSHKNTKSFYLGALETFFQDAIVRGPLDAGLFLPSAQGKTILWDRVMQHTKPMAEYMVHYLDNHIDSEGQKLRSSNELEVFVDYASACVNQGIQLTARAQKENWTKATRKKSIVTHMSALTGTGAIGGAALGWYTKPSLNPVQKHVLLRTGVGTLVGLAVGAGIGLARSSHVYQRRMAQEFYDVCVGRNEPSTIRNLYAKVLAE